MAGLLAFASLPGCGTPVPDISSANGKQQILDEADKALTSEDCATAVDLLLPLYNSSYSDNTVRLKMASAYGCDAKINFFKLIGDLANNASTLTSGGGLWGYLAQTFPSKSGEDHVVEGALLGTDALQAAIKPGTPVLPIDQVNPGSNNVGSVFGADRIDDANIYLLFISMAGIGGLEGRYGNPDSSYHPQSQLPWKKASLVTGDGCGYAASILNFFDSIELVGNDVSSNVGSTLTQVDSVFTTALALACKYGCTGQMPAGADAVILNSRGNWVATGCGFSSGCDSGVCPVTLRNRNSCTAQTTDQNSCAAAGLVNFINSSGAGWM